MSHPGARLFALLLALCLILPSSARAFDAPAFQGDVLDEAGLLAEADRSALAERIKTLRDDDGVWAAVYVARSLQGDSIEAAAVATFEKWRLGQAGKDNGVLVLVAPAERRMRIEVGYGLEGVLTDLFCRRVVDELYQPAFRAEQYADGLMQGFDAMAKAVHGEEALPELAAPAAPAEPPFDGAAFLHRFLAGLAGNLAVPLVYFLARARGRARGRDKGLGSRTGDTQWLLLSFGFFGVFFGLFFAVFGFAFPSDPEVMVGLVGMNLFFATAFALPLAGNVRAWLSDSAYRRELARQRLLRIRKRSPLKRQIFGVWFDPAEVTTSRGGTRPEPRGSSSGSSFGSSSSSSSSGGGRSGGGGASGSW
ncbi:TPM domain-containing protein [Parasulfuritortus cantonensis]|uniref:TPM domain-containing protein n=1 Tax=Parasulfuritortus cantonensis TaxID=2528202 RepID=A0A4R1BNI1_9PROT|nr:TPM domain-containing protein [Parasulfuritortus cantonensis]TCJ18948.1 TPM domain-containing protein [Parasulfuritortus cantonensis]